MARRYPALLGLAACATLGAAAARATPVIDGTRDADYTLVASSPSGNLLSKLGINDNTTPATKTLDVTNIYAANTGNALYIYVEMPYLDLSVVYGEWAIALHLGGSNDPIEVITPVADPYMSQTAGDANFRSVEYNHVPAPNAVVKSNFRGFAASSDGNQGYAFVNVASLTQTGWNFPNGNFLANGPEGWVNDVPNGTIHGHGANGGEIVYKNNAGLEMRIPFNHFGWDYPTYSDLQSPVIGDEIKMQFYDNLRQPNDATTRYPRGAIDAVPVQDDLHADPTHTVLTAYGSYTLTQPAAFDVTGAAAPKPTQVNVLFSDAVGNGAATAGNYTLTNVATSATVAVTAAQPDPTNTAAVTLTTAPLSPQTTYRLVVSNVQNTGGGVVSAAGNAATIETASLVVFNLYDPYSVVSSLGNDPNTLQPYFVTLTGTMNGFKDDGGSKTGAGEIPTHLVTGETPAHYQSDPIFASPGFHNYKWRIPGRGNYLNWDTLQPPGTGNRRAHVAKSTETQQFSDTAFNSDHHGAPVLVTFVLHDLDNKVNGRQVQVAGDFQSFNSDPSDLYKLTPVAGQPNTYSGVIDTSTVRPEYGQGGYFEYKFIIKPDPTGDPGNTSWDEFGAQNRYLVLNGSGSPLAQTVHVYVGGQTFLRALRIAGGLEPAPSIGEPFSTLDRDLDGRVTIRDVFGALPK
jgi:hypothetical protein